jgi:hypothetical protein
LVLFGVILGVLGPYYFFQRDLGSINDRLDAIQQQTAPVELIAPGNPSAGEEA